MGTQLPFRKGAEPPPQFLAHVHCVQTAGWIKMALGIQVGLGSVYIVLDLDPAPLPKRGEGRSPAPLPQKGGGDPSPIFGPFLLWPNGWMHQDATRYVGRPQPRQVCVRWGQAPPQKGGGAPSPILMVEVENFEIVGTSDYS